MKLAKNIILLVMVTVTGLVAMEVKGANKNIVENKVEIKEPLANKMDKEIKTMNKAKEVVKKDVVSKKIEDSKLSNN